MDNDYYPYDGIAAAERHAARGDLRDAIDLLRTIADDILDEDFDFYDDDDDVDRPLIATLCDELADALRDGRTTDAAALFDRALRPKWDSLKECEVHYEAIMNLTASSEKAA